MPPRFPKESGLTATFGETAIDEMTAKEFLDEVGPLDRDQRELTETEIDWLQERWSALIEVLDFHAKHWYEQDEHGVWTEISFGRVCAVLLDMGITDQATVIEQFRNRDTEAHSRDYDDVKEAQLRFKV